MLAGIICRRGKPLCLPCLSLKKGILMFVCPQCGYDKNYENALCCNLCGKVFKQKIDKDTIVPPTSTGNNKSQGISQQSGEKVIATITDLPPELMDKLLKDKAEVISNIDDSLFSKKDMRKGCLLIAVIVLGIAISLFLLYFLKHIGSSVKI